MSEIKLNSDEKTDIRKHAEKVLKGKSTDTEKLSSDDVQCLVYELQVHQIELEMQNEDLRKTQQELEDAQTKYSDLYDFAPLGYFTFDKNGSILEVNLTGAKKLGIERGKLIKKSFHLYIAPDFKDVFYLHLREVFNKQTQSACELRLVDKEGGQFDALLESLPVRDSDGNITCRTAVSDITQRKQAEKKLQESEARIRVILDASPDVIHLLDINGIILVSNEGFAKRVGKEVDDVIGKSVFDYTPAESVQNRKAAIEKVFRTGESLQFNDKGMNSIFESHIHPVFNPTEEVTAVAIYAHEITERVRAKKALQESELRLIRAQKIAHLADWEYDLESDIFTGSDEAYRIFGIEPTTELSYGSIRKMAHPDDRDSTDKHIMSLIETGTEEPFEFRVVRPDESIRHIYVQGEAVCDGTGNVVKLFGTFLDITRRKQAENELQKLNEELEQRVRERTGELEKKNRELAIMIKGFVMREERVIDLKKQVANLEKNGNGR